MTRELSAPPLTPIVWEAGLDRRVVLIEERLAIDARDKARAMLGGEPEYLTSLNPGGDYKPLFFFNYVTPYPERRSNYTRRSSYRHGGA